MCRCSNAGVERTLSTRQHTELTQKKKIFLLGFKFTTFWSWVWFYTNKLTWCEDCTLISAPAQVRSGGQDSLVGRVPDLWWKDCEFDSQQEWQGEFASPVLTFCGNSHSLSMPPHVIAVTCKRPQSFCQKCRWQVTPKHMYILDPTKSEWVDYAVQAQEPVRETSSHLKV